ncbi:MAG: hypothetical protein U9O78_00270 [Patescibacteria group bacterium]|nr:hypothetical protein [Patescibacteria group bacterium]
MKLNKKNKSINASPNNESEMELVNNIIAIKATDLMLELIADNQVKSDDQSQFIERFFVQTQPEVKSEVRVEQISLWLVGHGYASIVAEFEKRLNKYVEAELKPLLDKPADLEQFLGK